MLAGSLTVVTLSIGEFNLTWMLHTPFTKTLPVGPVDSYASMRLEIASAYTPVFFVMIVPLLMSHAMGPGPRARDTEMTLTLTNVSRTFPDGTRALTPVDLDLAPDEFVSLPGPSEGSKTTLSRIIAGLETPEPVVAMHAGTSAPQAGEAVRPAIAPGAVPTFTEPQEA